MVRVGEPDGDASRPVDLAGDGLDASGYPELQRTRTDRLRAGIGSRSGRRWFAPGRGRRKRLRRRRPSIPAAPLPVRATEKPSGGSPDWVRENGIIPGPPCARAELAPEPDRDRGEHPEQRLVENGHPEPFQLFATLTLSSAMRMPCASFCASSLAQKCMKKSRGCRPACGCAPPSPRCRSPAAP